MQRGYKLLIAGAGILALGLILIGITFVILKQQSFSINSSIETISPGKSIFKTSEVLAGKKMAIVVNYQPSDVPLNIQVIQQPGLTKVLDLNFTNRLFTNFMPNKDGMDNIMITNLGTKQVSANTIFGSSEFFDAGGQPKTALGAMAIAGPFLSFIGIIVLIIGGIFLLKDRIKGKRRDSSYNE
jgi:glucose uptake protein GlcU